MFLFVVAEDIKNSSKLVKLPELLRQEDLTDLQIGELPPDLLHEYPDTDCEFATPSHVAKTDTSYKNFKFNTN